MATKKPLPKQQPKKTDADTRPATDEPEAEPRAVPEEEKIKTVEDQGIGVRDPYPTGNPPKPEEE